MSADLQSPKTEAERLLLKVKTACCATCGGWITMAAFPRCESDAVSRREFAKHTKAGDVIDVMTVGESQKLKYCDCYLTKKSKKKAAAPGLFA